MFNVFCTRHLKTLLQREISFLYDRRKYYFLTITCKLFSHYVKKNQHAEKQKKKKTLKQKKISFIRQVKRISRWCLYF